MKLIIAITVFLLNILHNTDGLECNICDQRNWEQWSSCNQQCGGGLRSRHQEICCPESMDYDTCVHQKCNDIIASEDTSCQNLTVLILSRLGVCTFNKRTGTQVVNAYGEVYCA
jgi:hypothetical protein